MSKKKPQASTQILNAIDQTAAALAKNLTALREVCGDEGHSDALQYMMHILGTLEEAMLDLNEEKRSAAQQLQQQYEDIKIMTTAEDLYCGDEGTAYWQRNALRLKGERADRTRVLRNLVDYDPDQGWLEVGCGQGHNLLIGDVGLDCDPRQLARLPFGVIPIIGHAYDLSMFPDNSFEVVFSVGCLMHLPSRKPNCGISFDTSWQKAAAEMSRVSRRYVILGEYWAEKEREILGRNWDHCLWARPYQVPSAKETKRVNPLIPFDADVVFSIWKKL